MIEAGAPRAIGRNTPGSGVVPGAPGVVMLAPPEVPRNAQPEKAKGRSSMALEAPTL